MTTISHWELRPSLWIEPIGDWGEGEIDVLEIPTESENNDNIIAFWRPNAGLKAGEPISFAYRQFWCWTPPAKPDARHRRAARGMGQVGQAYAFCGGVRLGEIFADPAEQPTQVTASLDATPGQIVSTHALPVSR